MQRHVMKKQLSTFTVYYYFESVFEFTGFLCYLISADFVSVFVCLTAERNQKPLARAPSPPSNRLKSHHPPRSLPLPSELAALHLHQPTSRGKPDLPLISFPPIFSALSISFFLLLILSLVHLFLFVASLFSTLSYNLFLLFSFSPPRFHVLPAPWWPSFLSVITLCSETESRKRKEPSWLLHAVGFKRLIPCWLYNQISRVISPTYHSVTLSKPAPIRA